MKRFSYLARRSERNLFFFLQDWKKGNQVIGFSRATLTYLIENPLSMNLTEYDVWELRRALDDKIEN